MSTIRCHTGDVLTLSVKTKKCDGTYFPSAFPSATVPMWTLSDHTLAEFKEMDPHRNFTKVIALAIGLVDVFAVIDPGTVTFTLDIVDPPNLTDEPVGDYERNPPLRLDFTCAG